MKKSFLSLVAVSLVLFFSASVVFATSFSDLTWTQKQKYWGIITNDCVPLLTAKDYKGYRTCALNALETAAKYQENAAWCKDSDNGADYLQKGIVTTDIKPNGVADYIYTFPNGSTFLMEGMCSNTNKYYYIQKNCSDLGGKYHPDVVAGACVYVNHAPKLMTVMEKTEINEGEYYEIYLYGTDEDGDALIFSGENLPEGSIIDENAPVPPPVPVGAKHAVFSWTPTYEQAGEYEVTFKVSDGEAEDEVMMGISVKSGSPLIAWSKSLGYSNNDIFRDVTKLSDGNYVATGCSSDESNQYCRVWTVKFDEEGNIIWDKTYSGDSFVSQSASGVLSTDDGGYIIVGDSTVMNNPYCGSGILVMKFDIDGNIEWSNVYNGECYNGQYSEGSKQDLFSQSIKQTPDGGYILAGFSVTADQSPGDSFKGLLMRIDGDGNKLWSKDYDASDVVVPPGAFTAYSFRSIDLTSDGGYVLAGWAIALSKEQFWVIKTDDQGNEQWNKTFGGADSDGANLVLSTADGGYLVSGYMNAVNEDVYGGLLKLDSQGNKEWEKVLGTSGISSVNDIIIVSDGYAFAGYANGTNSMVVKTDFEGNEIWTKFLGEAFSDLLGAIVQSNDGGYISVGSDTSYSDFGGEDGWIVKIK